MDFLPRDQLIMVGCMLASYPLAFLYRACLGDNLERPTTTTSTVGSGVGAGGVGGKDRNHLNKDEPPATITATAATTTTTLRHLALALPGLWFGWVCFGSFGLAHFLAVTAYSYAIVRWLGRQGTRLLRSSAGTGTGTDATVITATTPTTTTTTTTPPTPITPITLLTPTTPTAPTAPTEEKVVVEQENPSGIAKQVSALKWIPVLAFAMILGHLSFCHIYRQWYNPVNAIDMSGPMMIIIIKTTSLVWSLWDGIAVALGQSHADWNGYQRASTIRPEATPGFLEYVGFLFYFPGFLAGPAIEFSQYRKLTREGLPKAGLSTWRPSLLRFAYALSFAGFHFASEVYFPTSLLTRVDYYYSMPDSVSSFLFRLPLMYLIVLGYKAKFYFAWLLSEGACVATGAGYNGGAWNGLSNVHVSEIELAPSMQEIMRCWNKKTHHWLKYYVLCRVFQMQDIAGGLKPKTLRKLAVYATYFVSAFWHGFYPGYYLTFWTAAVITTVEASLMQRKWFLYDQDKMTAAAAGRLSRWWYRALNTVVAQLLLAYTVLPFISLDWQVSLRVWFGLYFVGHVYIVLAYASARFLGHLFLRPRRSLQRQPSQGAAGGGAKKASDKED